MPAAAGQGLRRGEQAVVQTEVPTAGVEQRLGSELLADRQEVHDAERLVGDADRPRQITGGGLLLDDGDRRAAIGEPQGCRQPDGPAADDDDIAKLGIIPVAPSHAALPVRAPPAFVFANCTSSYTCVRSSAKRGSERVPIWSRSSGRSTAMSFW